MYSSLADVKKVFATMVQVSMILSDPKTTNDPMMAWVVNKQQVGHKAIYVRYVYIFVQLCFSSNMEWTARQSSGSNFSVLSLDRLTNVQRSPNEVDTF